MLCDVELVVPDDGSGGARGPGRGLYMTAHWVAPQQSLMMATPDLVMEGLLGGTSRICLLGLGGPWRRGWRCGGKGEQVVPGRDIRHSGKNEAATYFAGFLVSSPEASASGGGTRPSPCPPPAPFKAKRWMQATVSDFQRLY